MTPTYDELVEVGAMSLCLSDGAYWDASNYRETPSGETPDEMREGYRAASRDFIEALRGAMVPVGWETFSDPSYYDMWCVRPVGSRTFGEGFHLINGDEAKWLARHLSNLYALPTPEDK